jgi:hypothetical protein
MISQRLTGFQLLERPALSFDSTSRHRMQLQDTQEASLVELLGAAAAGFFIRHDICDTDAESYIIMENVESELMRRLSSG